TAKYGREFIDEFFIGHHFQRYLSNKYRHPQPFYFFPLVTLAGGFPWSFCLVFSLVKARVRRLFKLWCPASSDPISSEPISSERDPVARLNLFLRLWIIAPILFFSFSGSKLPGYILPIFPAIALIVGRELDRWWSDESSPPKAQSYLTAALIVVAGMGLRHRLAPRLGGVPAAALFV